MAAVATADDRLEDRIRRVLKDHGRLNCDAQTLADGDNLYAAGLTSHASVNIMLALEAEFDVEFPDEMLTRRVFDSVASIRDAIARLKAA